MSNSAPLPAEELLRQWTEAVKARDENLSRRMDNMFRGPIGVEEAIAMTRDDVSMAMWFLDKLIKREAAREKSS